MIAYWGRELYADTFLLLPLMVFSLAVFLADLYPIVLPTRGNAEITISCAFKTAAALLYGPAVAVPATLIGTLIAELVLHRAWYKAVFNASEMTLTLATMSVLYNLLYDGIARMPFNSLQNAGAVGMMGVTYVMLNVGLVTGVVSLSTGAPFWRVWKAHFRESSWNNMTIIPLGAVVATLWHFQPWSVLALLLPVIAVRKSFEYIGELKRMTREALFRIADAIDHRDRETYWHSQRVADIALAIAGEMDLSVEEVDTLSMAARLHDLGKIGMSNSLLFKPGRFDSEEWAEFQRHPIIGSQLIKSFRLFSDVQELILHHHERYDGAGYPSKLAKNDIPLGARILNVADSFDAMTTQRAYNHSRSLDEAKTELLSNKGTQFDPQIADTLVRLIEKRDRRIWIHEEEPQLSMSGV